jgi:hypothetical protein
MYVQCKLVNGTSVRVAWIPSSLAIEGMRIWLKETSGVRTSGWIVKEIYSMKSEEDLNRHNSFARNTIYQTNLNL